MKLIYSFFLSLFIFRAQVQAQMQKQPRTQDSALNRIDSLGEVVITGVSRAISIRQNPVAIASVSARAMDRALEPNVIDALVKNVPGLNSVKTGPNISKPFIRGLGYNRVLTLYDGVRQEGQQWGDEHGIEVDAYNIEKAEVIKGPASLMFGSDALAGVVSLFPWQPKEKDGQLHGRVVSEYQSNNGLWGEGIRLGFAKEHWFWTAKGSWRKARNYSNAIDGRVYNTGFRELNASASAGYESAKGSSIFNLTLYDNLQGIPDGSRDSLTRAFTYQVAEGDQDNIKGRPIVTDAALNSYTLSPLHQHIQHYRLYSNHRYRLGSGELNALIGWQQNKRREYSHPLDPSQAGLNVRLNTLNYGLRYLAPSIGNLELSMGIGGMLQGNRSLSATDHPIPDYSLWDIGGFGHARWKYGKLNVSGGLRLDNRILDTKTAYGFQALHKNFTGVSMSAGAALELFPWLHLKANIARGYRSPNITEIASQGLDPGAHIIYLGNPAFKPEFSLQTDLGLNAYFDEVDLSVSVFHNSLRNYIYLQQLVDSGGSPILDPQGNKTFQYQQAAARIYGGEATLQIHPKALQGFSFSNAIVMTYGVNTMSTLRHSGTMGEYLPLIPPLKYTGSIGQEFKPRTGWSVNLRAELEYNAAQTRYLSLYNTETLTPSYALMNVSAGLGIHGKDNRSIQLNIQVNNLTDLANQNNLSRLKYFEYYTASPNGHSGIYNMGRNFCMKLVFDW